MKKHEDQSLHRTISLRCSKQCGFEIDIMNMEWGETSKQCPDCMSEIEEYYTCGRIVNLDRRKNWRQGLSQERIVECLHDHKKNPY